MIVNLFALTIWTTRCRIARVWWWLIYNLVASNEGIARKTLYTSARREMVKNTALSVCSTSTGARIRTFVSNASFILWTIGIIQAFWSTSFVRITLVLSYACTNSIVAKSIRPARIGIAKIRLYKWC